MRILTLTLALFSMGLFAQNAANTASVSNADEHKLIESESVIGTEKVLDERVAKIVLERMNRHTKLFGLKVKALPTKTVLTKGKFEEKDGKVGCVEPKETVGQQNTDNDCLKLEVFDFLKSEEGKSALNLGSRSKYIIVQYEGGSKAGNGSEEDPFKEPERKVKKVFTKISEHDFIQQEHTVASVKDEEPGAENKDAKSDLGGSHDEKTLVFYQNNGLPFTGTKQNMTEKGVGLYTLKHLENSKVNPLRNDFKKAFYVKNLEQFDKLFTQIEDMNERYVSKKYKETNQFVKGSLKY